MYVKVLIWMKTNTTPRASASSAAENPEIRSRDLRDVTTRQLTAHGSVTTWTKLNRKWSGKSVLKHTERVCCSWLQWKVDKGVFFPCFSFQKKKKKWSQKMTVANGNESMGPSHKEVGTKTPRCALLKALFPPPPPPQKKNASQIALCWAFSFGSNTCPQGNRLGKIYSSNLQGWSFDAIASSWAFVYFPLVIPSLSSLVRCVAFRSFSLCLL